ncbi:hypothetical protein GP486_006405 [Trichoglossum hirsutum]|uniref:TM7S3/TM198-like domain-containing protein n=1 Tax=Trichoglossum hirsutum TaxID=265104 RepID=A0A9P8I862_9PEZI|nr:hypothetical protein GP486_006405 [Trichoglossum hirsutum]
MRTIRFLFCAFLALHLILNAVTASERNTAQRRQDKNASTLPSSDSQGTKTTAQSGGSAKSPSLTDSPSSSRPTTTQTDPPPTNTSQVLTTSPPVSATLSAPTPSATNGTSSVDQNALPIHPSVTPGLSVAGVILLVSGMVYTLIGIKNKRLHIFLSTAYLTSLAAAVLIIYVMNPPVGNGIQGAYVVAAVLTGLIFGALSIVFAEVTEGLGCLLGGFCLGMWFLALKPGGLVTSTGGKVALIAAFSLTVFSLSFSHHTRPYGLIGAISFAGLNDNIFPLNTTMYPHTRGIRVEIAAIILVFLVGIISQLKLWRVIKERREHREEERRQGERDLEALEEDLGRKNEEDSNRERAQWEAVYGDKEPSPKGRKTDSAISGLEVDSGKESLSGVETVDNRRSGEEDQIEMVDMGASGPPRSSQVFPKETDNSKKSPLVTVRVGRDDGQSGRRAEGEAEPSTPKAGQLSARNSFVSRRSVISPSAGSQVVTHDTLQPSVAPPPPVVPLPFTIPAAAEESDNEEDGSSVATFADSHRAPARNTKRSSGVSLLRRLSARNSRAMSCDEESLIVPHIEDDRASSIAATIDDMTEDGRSSTDGPRIVVSSNENADCGLGDFGLKLGGLSPGSSSGPSPSLPTRPNSIAALPTAQDDAVDNTVHRPYSMIDLRGSRNDPEKEATKGITSYWFTRTSIELKDQSESANKKDKDSTVKGKTSTASLQATKAGLSPGLKVEKFPKSASPSVISGQESLAAGLSVQQLPRRVSKVVMSYRTNEWAKHLDAAEKPELEDLKLADYPEETQQNEAEEAPRPVNADELQQTANNATPPPAPTRTMSQTSFSPSQPTSGHSRSKHNSRVSFTDWQQGQPFQPNSFYQQGITSRTTSSYSLQRALSPSTTTTNLPQSAMSRPQSPIAAHRGLRSASTPLLAQAHIGSPIMERVDPIDPLGIPIGNTLLDQRESMVRNKFAFVSTPHLPTSPEPAAAAPAPTLAPTPVAGLHRDSASMHNYRLGVLDDDIPLKDRRELIQRQAMMQSLEQQPATVFDSHQPARPESRSQPADKREAMLAAWRESVRHDLTQTQLPKFAVETRRADMLNDRQQSLLNQRQQALATNYRDSVLDERMRRGDMLDLHKEVLRKMQANANKHV